jgi:hypothetical protein
VVFSGVLLSMVVEVVSGECTTHLPRILVVMDPPTRDIEDIDMERTEARFTPPL